MLNVGAKLAERLKARLRSWPKHPLDARYGIETSNRVRGLFIGTGNSDADRGNTGYVGSQPSIVRMAIEALPAARGALFYDLGCGKGRVLAVVAEYPFAKITGIELVPRIASVARRNMAKVAAARVACPPFEVLTGDATIPALPADGVVVLFLSNPFRVSLFERFMAHVEAALAASPNLKIFIIYYNPTQVVRVDGSSAFARYLAARPVFAPEEIATSPFGNDRDSIVIWQSVGGDMAPAVQGADRDVRVVTPDFVADVQV